MDVLGWIESGSLGKLAKFDETRLFEDCPDDFVSKIAAAPAVLNRTCVKPNRAPTLRGEKSQMSVMHLV
jgi:hypothetical protein